MVIEQGRKRKRDAHFEQQEGDIATIEKSGTVNSMEGHSSVTVDMGTGQTWFHFSL